MTKKQTEGFDTEIILEELYQKGYDSEKEPYCRGFIDGARFQHQQDTARIADLEGILDLKNDEYVKQVGTWKIIQRLEEESKEKDARIAELEKDLQWKDHWIVSLEKFSKDDEIQRLRSALKRYPCQCETTIDDVKKAHPQLECFRCKALNQGDSDE